MTFWMIFAWVMPRQGNDPLYICKHAVPVVSHMQKETNRDLARQQACLLHADGKNKSKPL